MNNTISSATSEGSQLADVRPTNTASELTTQRADRAFGANMRAVRERLGLTQPQFAKRLGQSTSYISLLESGQRRPTERVIANLRAAVELTPQEEADFDNVDEVRDPITQLVQYATSVLGSRAGADDYYRQIIHEDLTRIFRGYVNLLQGQQHLLSSRFPQALAQFERILADGDGGEALSAPLRVAAGEALADVALKQGNPESASAAICRAQRLLDTALPNSAFHLRAEAHAMRGMIDLRAGAYGPASASMTAALDEYKKLTATEPRERRVAAAGLTKSYNRLALLALLKGDPQSALSYCLSGLDELKWISPDENDLTDTRRTRIIALQAWAFSALGRFNEARVIRARVHEAYEKANDAYGIAKSWLYQADDMRREVKSVVEKLDDALANPQTRIETYRQRLHQHVDGTEIRELVERAKRYYEEAIKRLEQLEEALLLSRAYRGLGDMDRYLGLLASQTHRQESTVAERHLQYALELGKRAKQGRITPGTLESLAQLEWDAGHLARARDLFDQASTSLRATDPQDDYAASNRLERYRESAERVKALAVSQALQAAAPSLANGVSLHLPV